MERAISKFRVCRDAVVLRDAHCKSDRICLRRIEVPDVGLGNSACAALVPVEMNLLAAVRCTEIIRASFEFGRPTCIPYPACCGVCIESTARYVLETAVPNEGIWKHWKHQQ